MKWKSACPCPTSLSTLHLAARHAHELARLKSTDAHALAALGVSNGRNKRSRMKAASIPRPVSATSIIACCGVRRSSTCTCPSGAVASWALRITCSSTSPSRSALTSTSSGGPSTVARPWRRAPALAGDPRSGERFGTDLRELHAPRRSDRIAAPQLLEQPVHPLHRVVDGRDRVVDELRIVAVTCRVLHHQRLLRDQVLEVVHHERCEAIIGLELPRLRELRCGLIECDVARRLAPDGAQQIELLPGERLRGERAREHDDATRRSSCSSGTTSHARSQVEEPIRQLGSSGCRGACSVRCASRSTIHSRAAMKRRKSPSRRTPASPGPRDRRRSALNAPARPQ